MEAAELTGHVGKPAAFTEAEASQIHKGTELSETPHPGGRQAAWPGLSTSRLAPSSTPALGAPPPASRVDGGVSALGKSGHLQASDPPLRHSGRPPDPRDPVALYGRSWWSSPITPIPQRVLGDRKLPQGLTQAGAGSHFQQLKNLFRTRGMRCWAVPTVGDGVEGGLGAGRRPSPEPPPGYSR